MTAHCMLPPFQSRAAPAWRVRATAVLAMIAIVGATDAAPAWAQAPAHTAQDTPPLAEPEGALPPEPVPAAPPAPRAPAVGLPADADPRASTDARAQADAERDAEVDIGAASWLVAGCIVSVYAVVAAYFVDTSPPYARLIGRSPEYIAAYVPVYRQTASDTRLRYAMLGCGGSLVLTLGFVVLTAVANNGGR